MVELSFLTCNTASCQLLDQLDLYSFALSRCASITWECSARLLSGEPIPAKVLSPVQAVCAKWGLIFLRDEAIEVPEIKGDRQDLDRAEAGVGGIATQGIRAHHGPGFR
jgi:hypothetical protein